LEENKKTNPINFQVRKVTTWKTSAIIIIIMDSDHTDKGLSLKQVTTTEVDQHEEELSL